MAVAEDLARVPDNAVAAEDRKTPGQVKFAYSLGQAVESGYIAIAAYVFFYYTAVLGLSGSMVGVALALSMCLDAAGDPFIGSFSDGIRSRLGRRLPMMLVGAPLTLLTMGLLFSPPSGLSPFLLFAWLTLTKMGVRFFASVFNIPYFALGGELSDGYVERAQIVAFRLLSGIIVTVLITALAYSLFFNGPGGLQQPERYPAFGWTIAILVAVVGLISSAGVRRYASSLPQPTAAARPVLRRLPGELLEIFRNRSFRTLFLSLLIFASAAGVSSALNAHVYVFVWKLRPETIQFLTYMFLAGILIGIPLTPPLLSRFEKKTVVLIGFGLVIGTWMVLPPLRALGLYMPTGAAALPALLATIFVIGLGSGLIFIAYPSMMADAADEHEELFGSRREGLYFAGLGFAGKAAAGIGLMIGGFTLDFLHFPREAGRQIGAVVPEHVLSSLIVAWGPLPAVLCMVGAAIFLPYAITRSRQHDIAATLKLKRAADVVAGRSS